MGSGPEGGQPLPARDAYRRWAAHYEAETAVSHLEQQVVAQLGVATRGRRLLDVGCGTARRLRGAGATVALGIDLSPEMLQAARGAPLLAVADVRALPVASASFDVVWCRLVIGHVRELGAAYAELSRACRAGGAVIVTDLCPAAVAAGHRRTFRDAGGQVREVEHHVHTAHQHARAARDAGLAVETRRDGVVGPDIRRFYDAAGKLAAYEEQRDMPLVLALLMRRVEA